jgi:hypothetical protein
MHQAWPQLTFLSATSEDLARNASMLQDPPPAKAKYRKTKQYRIAASPPFKTGKKLRGA